tara:strand:+ start:564 stop:1241 length:678 start_codon:yes stop_codon:yes gene_type:complete
MDLREAFLLLHVACGSIALLTAALAFLTEKGPKFHAKVGRYYALAMSGVGLTAGALWWLGSTEFLLFIAFFSTYMVLVGWRLGQNRKGVVDSVDRTLVGMGLVGTVGLLFISIDIAFGLVGLSEESTSFAVVPLVFAFICGFLTYFQRLSLKSGVAPRGKERIRLHGIFMGAGTISTVTAFSLTAVGGGVVMWLLPTAIGTPLIVWNLGGLRTGRVQVPVNTDAA